MPMYVTVEDDLPLLLEGLDKALGFEDLWEKYLRRCFPSSIQVSSREAASVVAIDDAIRVHHGHNLEDHLFSQDVGFWCLTE